MRQASGLAHYHGFEVRSLIEDGASFMVTLDYVANRINVEVRNGLVTRVIKMG